MNASVFSVASTIPGKSRIEKPIEELRYLR
jgi:hypothetical protein